jgi:hypothetical protein
MTNTLSLNSQKEALLKRKAELEGRIRARATPSAHISGTSSQTSTSTPVASSDKQALLRRKAELEARIASRQKPQTDLWDTVKAFGSGVGEGIKEMGTAFAKADPDANMILHASDQMTGRDDFASHQGVLDAAQQQLMEEREHAKASLSPLAYTARTAGNWVGSGLATPIPGGGPAATATKAATKILPQVLKTAGKEVLRDAGLGTISGGLQTQDVSPLVADLTAAYGAPLAKKAITSSAKAAYKSSKFAVSPQYREEIAKKGAERDVGQLLGEELLDGEKASPEAMRSRAQEISVPRALHPLQGKTANATETGAALRQYLESTVDQQKKRRTAATAPLYQKLEESRTRVEPQNTGTLLDEKLQFAKGSTRKSLANVKKELVSNTDDLHPNQIQERHFWDEFLAAGGNPEVAAQHAPPPRNRNPYPIEIDKTLQWLGDEIETAITSGSPAKAKELMKVKRALTQDLETTPVGRNYRDIYAKLSQPINAIVDHPIFGSLVAKDPRTGRYKLADAELPEKVITSSLKSEQTAQDLMGIFKHNPKTKIRKQLEHYIHKDVLDNILDIETGEVSLRRLLKYRKDHPGVFTLHPKLRKKIDTLENAKRLTDQITTKARKLPTFEAYQMLPVALFKKAFRKLPLGSKVVDLMTSSLGENKLNIRNEVLQKALQNPDFATILMTPVAKEGIIHHRMNRLNKTLRDTSVVVARHTGSQNTGEKN